METQMTTFRCPVALRTKLQALAKERGVAMSDLMLCILEAGAANPPPGQAVHAARARLGIK